MEFEYENFFYIVPDLVSIATKEGCFIKLNSQWEKTLGYTTAELLQTSYLDFIHPEDIESTLSAIKTLDEDSLIFNFTNRYRCKKGTYRILEWRSKQEKNGLVYSTARDITEQKKIETDLIVAKERAEKQEERHLDLLKNIDAGIIVHAQDTSITLCNSRAEELLGLSDAQMKGKVAIDPEWKFIDEDNAPLPLSDYPVMQISHKKTPIKNQFLGVCRSSGDIVWLMVNGFPVLNNKNEIVEIIISFIDITKQKQSAILLEENKCKIENQIEKLRQANDQLQTAKEKAEESDRLKTVFLQNMSHEIRTPMNAILGFTDLINDPDLTAENRISFASIIKNSTNQLLTIITDILSISAIETKQETVYIDEVSINNILIDQLTIFKTQASNLNISLHLQQPLSNFQAEVFTDKTKLTQILTNLLTNALKFTHEGFIEFGYNLKNNQIEFFVKDTGIGIHPEMHVKIFERFRQANENIIDTYGGTGLGLAISKAFTELLGGKIWVESELGHGSTFYFTIPYKPVHEMNTTDMQMDTNQQKITILIAEDEEFNYLYLQELLTKSNIHLVHTRDGNETVEYCQSHPKIDLILMDIKMPKLDGFSAAKLIKEFNPKVPIVAQSAYALVHERVKYEGKAFDEYITKPISKETINRIMIQFIGIDILQKK